MARGALKPLHESDFEYWSTHHLLNRAGFGGTPGQVRALTNMGLENAVDYIVDYQGVSMAAVEADRFDEDIMRPRSDAERNEIAMARQAGNEAVVERLRLQRQAAQRADRQQMREIQIWWLARMIETPRPLEEKLTLFWHGHFATSYRKIEDSYHMFRQNQMFRAGATGSFKALAHDIIRDPAMLKYLDNNRNVRRSPNENLARELMELFTLGEGNAYTEQDIKEGARALTGYTYDDNNFVFAERAHDSGPKRILGKIGNYNGEDFVNIILTKRACSEFLCLKLYRFFVNDMPGEPTGAARKFIIELAKLFRDTNYSIKAVLKTMFTSAHFYEQENVASMIKSPIQLIIEAIRSLRTPTRNLAALVGAGDLMGQNIFYPPSVKGWPGGRTWINTSTLFVRQNLLVYLLTGRRPDAYPWEKDGSNYDAMHLIEHLRDETGAIDVEQAVVYLLRFTLGREPHRTRVDELKNFVKTHGNEINNTLLVALLSLITAMPEYQLC